MIAFQVHAPRHSCRAVQIRRIVSSLSTDAGNSNNSNNNNSDDHDGDDNKVSTTRVHKVTWKTSHGEDDIVFEAFDGELLRTAALRRGMASPHNGRANLINCRGLGTCGTCAVTLEGGWIPPPNTIESVRLSMPPGHGGTDNDPSRLRLSCQIPVRGNVTVQKFSGFWGQYDQLVSPTVPTRPFGPAEYILDRTSPPSLPKSRESKGKEEI